jgi:DNA-binding GntR family transcriptional regulator
VLDALRYALFDGRFSPGQDVSDAALAAEFQVSRGPVREALLLLTEEGLLQHHHNRGFRIPKISQEDLRKIVMVRQPLEIQALEGARMRIRPEDIARMAEKAKAIDDAFASGGLASCSRAEFDFHQEAWVLSGNEWLVAALRRVCQPYFTFVSAFGLGRKDMTSELLHRQHQLYVQYLAGETTDTAAECVNFHLTGGC